MPVDDFGANHGSCSSATRSRGVIRLRCAGRGTGPAELREHPVRHERGKDAVRVERVRADPDRTGFTTCVRRLRAGRRTGLETASADASGHHGVGQRAGLGIRTVEQHLAAHLENARQTARVRHVRLGLAAPAQDALRSEAMGALDERRPQRRPPHGRQPRGVNLDPGACHRTAPPGRVLPHGDRPAGIRLRAGRRRIDPPRPVGEGDRPLERGRT